MPRRVVKTNYRKCRYLCLMVVSAGSGVVPQMGLAVPDPGRVEVFLRRTGRNAELRARNEELERLNRLKSDLTAITSHDLNSPPLASVVSLARMVRDEARSLPPERVERAMNRLIDGGLRLRKLVHDILDLERIEAGTFKLNKRHAYLDAVLTDVAEGKDDGDKGVHVELNVQDGAPALWVDGARLEQVFTNLLSNAMRFSPRGGTILVEHSVEEGRSRVSIAEEGPGIPEADLDQIFDRYFQVERRHSVPKRGFGAGLGLSIVKEIVSLHDGRVWAENRPSGGCRFVVELPESTVVNDLQVLRAVIVDPRGTDAPLIEASLADKGLDVLVLDDADVARRVLRQERPHLAFVCGCPGGLGGIERLSSSTVPSSALGRCSRPVISCICPST